MKLLDTIGRRNRSLPDKNCECCGKLFRPVDSKKRTCSRDCGYKIRKCNPHNKGKGKGWVNSKGYREIKIDGKDVKEHRYLVEQKIGRKLLQTEIIHHDDTVKTNNDINNLKILSNEEHTRLHNKTRLYKKGYKIKITDEERLRRSNHMRLLKKATE